MPSSFIRIRKVSFQGLHCWPEAPEPVSFLRTLHRHVFEVEAEFAVGHGNRQLEFFMVQADVKAAVARLSVILKSNPHLSCEMMAERLAKTLLVKYPSLTEVTVSEDGENVGIYRLVEIYRL